MEEYPDLTLIFAVIPFNLSGLCPSWAMYAAMQFSGCSPAADESIVLFPNGRTTATMALILSIELNNATFEDLATLVSTAGAAGADDSTVIEVDEEQQVLRVIIDEPIAPDVDTSDPTEFRLIDDGYDLLR